MIRISGFLVIASTVFAAHPFGGPLAATQRTPLLMQAAQADSARRVPALVRLRADGPAATGAEVKVALSKIDASATGSMKNLLRSTKPAYATVENLRQDFRNWKAASDAARALVKTDHHKDHGKFAEMDRAYQSAEKAFEDPPRMTPTPAGGTATVTGSFFTPTRKHKASPDSETHGLS